jgi:hypothetical protein
MLLQIVERPIFHRVRGMLVGIHQIIIAVLRREEDHRTITVAVAAVVVVAMVQAQVDKGMLPLMRIMLPSILLMVAPLMLIRKSLLQ